MNIQQLEYFIEAAHTLNFTRAAEKFFISQSAMTQQIKNLEEELGVVLFERKNRRVYLTDAGKLFVSEAQSLISHTNDVINKLQAVQKGYSGSLSIGYMESVQITQLPLAIQKFHQKYPGVQLKLNKESYDKLYDNFEMGQYDAIINLQLDEYDYPVNIGDIPVDDYGFSVLMPIQHHLIGKSLIRQEDLREEPLIMKDMDRFRHKYQKGEQWSTLNSELYQNIVAKEKDLDSAIMKVVAGVGLAIVPDFDVSLNGYGLNLTYVPLDTNGFKVSVHLYYNRDNRNPLLPLFLKEWKELI